MQRGLPACGQQGVGMYLSAARLVGGSAPCCWSGSLVLGELKGMLCYYLGGSSVVHLQHKPSAGEPPCTEACQRVGSKVWVCT